MHYDVVQLRQREPARRNRRAAFAAIAAWLAVLVGLIAWVPLAWTAPGTLPSVTDQAGAVLLGLAALTARILLGWTVLALVIAALARTRGVAGVAAACILGRLLPAAARPVLLAAAGAVLVTGCAHATPAGTATEGMAAPAAHPPQVAIDWPDAPAAPGIDWPVPGTGGPALAGTPTTPIAPKPLPRAADDTALAQAPACTTPATSHPVTVRPGDTLWALAAHASPGSGAAQIDHCWRAWYRTNRGVIGTDPNLILPGQHLLPPTNSGGHQ